MARHTGSFRRCYLTENELIIGKFSVPGAPEFEAARFHLLRLADLASAAIEASEGSIQLREPGRITQVIEGSRLRSDDMGEELLVKLASPAGIARFSFVIRFRARDFESFTVEL